jgi:hypothetical protein
MSSAIPSLSNFNNQNSVVEFTRNLDQKMRNKFISNFSSGITKVFYEITVVL